MPARTEETCTQGWHQVRWGSSKVRLRLSCVDSHFQSTSGSIWVAGRSWGMELGPEQWSGLAAQISGVMLGPV